MTLVGYILGYIVATMSGAASFSMFSKGNAVAGFICLVLALYAGYMLYHNLSNVVIHAATVKLEKRGFDFNAYRRGEYVNGVLKSSEDEDSDEIDARSDWHDASE